jgi:hypothetical protein
MYIRINNNVAIVLALISKFSHNVTSILRQNIILMPSALSLVARIDSLVSGVDE